jgi:predicted RecB family nuclease
MAKQKILKTCIDGHTFYKSSDCPVCPDCEAQRKPKDHFLSLLAASAKRALENNGILSLDQLSQYSEKEILNLHGMGKSSLPKLQKLLADHQLSFKK